MIFDGRYDVETAGPFYEQVPGVETYSPNHVFPGPGSCFYRRADGGRVYFFEEWLVLLPSAFPVRLVRAELDRYGMSASFTDAEPPYSPQLEDEYEACKAGSLNVLLELESVEIPALSKGSLTGLALLIALSGLAV